jgi:predicted negative regulator of RcsB-dependent stress response
MDLNILWIYFLTETSDFTMALTYAKSFDKRFSDNGKQALNLANYIAANDSSFLSEKNFLVAESAYKYVIDKGKTLPNSIDARSGLLELYFNKAAHSVMPDKTMLNNLDIEYQQLITEIGFNEKSVSIIRNWAKMLAVYKNDFERADSLLNAAIKIPRLKNSLLAQCKLDLADLYLLTGEVWEASLLYSQVEKDFKYDELGFEAKFRNARLSYFIGEFGWALAQLEVLRASTSKLIANDAMELSLLISENSDEGEDSNFTALKIFAQADLMMEQKNYAQARRFLDSLSENFPYHSLADEILYQRANIAIAEKNYSAALQYLADIYQNFPNDLLADDAIILSARIYDDILKDKFSTLPLLEKIIIEYPSSIYIDEARERYK